MTAAMARRSRSAAMGSLPAALPLSRLVPGPGDRRRERSLAHVQARMAPEAGAALAACCRIEAPPQRYSLVGKIDRPFPGLQRAVL